MKMRLALAALATAPIAAPAAAQPVRSTDPATVLQALRSGGHAARPGEENGNPKIDITIGSTDIVLYFMDCERGGRACRSMQLHSSYDTTSPPLETINRWNRDTRHARAFVQPDGDPVLEMDIGLDNENGMSRQQFLATLDSFVRLLPQFERLIGVPR